MARVQPGVIGESWRNQHCERLRLLRPWAAILLITCMLLTAAFISEAGSERVGPGKGARTEILLGSVAGGFVYGLEPEGTHQIYIGERGQPAKLTTLRTSLCLLKGPLRVDRNAAPKVWKYSQSVPFADLDAQPHWRIRYGAYWGSVTDIPVNAFAHVFLKDMDAVRWIPPEEAKKMTDIEQGRYTYRLLRHLHWIGWDGDFLSEEEAFSDFLPTGPDALVVLYLKEGRMERRKASIEVKERRVRNSVTLAKEPDAAVKATWSEPFVAFGDSTGYYFVTQAGKVHAWTHPGKEDQAMVTVWDDAQRPVRAVISDADRGKDFAFTAAPPAKGAGEDGGKGKEGRPVYFELALRADARSYELPAAEELKEAERLAPVYRYVRFLQDQGKIAR